MPKRLTDRERLLRAVTERQWQSQVEQMLTATGWLWYHAPDNRPINGHVQNIKAGFLDLCAVRGMRILFAELKTETGTVSDKQEVWLDQLGAAGAEVYVWRPSDQEEVLRVLQPDWKTSPCNSG